MTYTDAPNAQEQMNEFISRCQENDILCDSFHFSSGYTSIVKSVTCSIGTGASFLTRKAS